MKILLAASEVVPFAKTGGLADVAGALPNALHSLGHDVRVIMPRYRAIDAARAGLAAAIPSLTVPVGRDAVDAALLEGRLPKTEVRVYFVDIPRYFDRDGLYNDRDGDYPDNLERFSAFCQTVLQALPQLSWQPDILHTHDWQTALLPAHLATTHAHDRFWQPVGTVTTIHNLAYQGVFPRAQWPATNLPDELFGIDGLEFYGQINCLKGALRCSDLLTTVSPTYANEILTREHGAGLEGVLASRRSELVGILNGIDVDEWNPKTDPHLPAHYWAGEPAGKSICKLSLQATQRLPQHHVLVIGMIQRLVEQKGIDLVVEAAEALLALPVQLVVLGTGDPAYHAQLKMLAERYPDKLALNLTFDNALAHQIEAGADAFLMPSRFEPCGLNQLYSMRYGTVPIVRKVGGLADTVIEVTPQTLADGRATGFVFEPYTPAALLEAVRRAVAAFGDHALWSRLVDAGMRHDGSWARSARAYVDVYQRAVSAAPATRS